MTYAFAFDASACSGCKACQIACKDKNDLPAGVLWRRVYEIAGGSWTNVGAGDPSPGVWRSTVFAYHLSLACNHCVHPKCAGVCPTDAYVVRQDGIVYIDGDKCMGCGYCAWACPYSAPQYHPELGRMTKCDLCHDRLDAGQLPSCVAACPMRVLDLANIGGDAEMLPQAPGKLHLWETPGETHPYPLPSFSRTEPRLSIKKHSAMDNSLEKMITNREEVRPHHKGARSEPGEIPLVIFTLCAQAAAGVTFFSLFSRPLHPILLGILGLLLAVSGISSIFHLGTPLNAWRSLGHLKKSWLSREILLFLLFSACWLLSWPFPGMAKLPLALTGLGLVYSMAQVYRLRSVPAWNNYRTLLNFLNSALILGGLIYITASSLANIVLVQDLQIPAALLSLGLFAAILLCLASRRRSQRKGLHALLYGLALAGILVTIPLPALSSWSLISVFLFVLIAEIDRRILFYESRRPIL